MDWYHTSQREPRGCPVARDAEMSEEDASKLQHLNLSAEQDVLCSSTVHKITLLHYYITWLLYYYINILLNICLLYYYIVSILILFYICIVRKYLIITCLLYIGDWHYHYINTFLCCNIDALLCKYITSLLYYYSTILVLVSITTCFVFQLFVISLDDWITTLLDN